MIKISIIIPVYNVELYLEQCLNSVLAQTLKDIEVICVDDCSKDNSYHILEEFSNMDIRVKVYHFEESKSALQARKAGVMAASGEYIMFLDADDYLESDACRSLYEKIRNENVEILHFSSHIINCANLPEKRIQQNEKAILPCEQRFEEENVFKACFVEKKYSITLWNKVFKTELCKKAFDNMEDQYLPKAQDLYSYFVIAYYAKSYYGWIGEPLHNYCFGRGVTGSNSMDLDKFERYCTQAKVVYALRKFCAEKKVLEQNEAIIDQYYEQWITECVQLWKNELPKEYSVDGLEILYRYWGNKKTVAAIAKESWYQRTEIATKLEGFPKISIKDREVKTIAIYYYHFTIGGVQRVISLLAPMFIKMGYKVVIITDSEASTNDFPLPEGVIRTSILSRENVDRGCFELRLESWKQLSEKYKFDLVLYNAWTSKVLLWDLLYLKKEEIPVVIHAHSVFSFAVNRFQNLFSELPRTFSLADGIVVLSEADKAFWDAYNERVYCIPNPVSQELYVTKSGKWENKSLIWVGRVSNEKQPWAIFSIMEKVVRQVPEARLYLLGNFEDEKWHKMAIDKGIEDSIVFCGEVQEVNSYYEKASVHVATSKYEGFLMTLLESQAHNLPTVMFNMPNLMLGTKEHGVIGVDMLDYTSAASEIVKLLLEEEKWNKASQLAKESYERLKLYDFEGAWEKVLKGEGVASSISAPVMDMIHTLVNHYYEGIKFQDSQKKVQGNLKKDLDRKNQEISSIKNSLSFRTGRMITYIPRKIRGFIWCCKEHGFVYTITYALEKMRK